MRNRETWKNGSPRVRFDGRTSDDQGERSLDLYPGPDDLTYVEQVNPGGTSYGEMYVSTTELVTLAQREDQQEREGQDFLALEITGQAPGGGSATLIVKTT